MSSYCLTAGLNWGFRLKEGIPEREVSNNTYPQDEDEVHDVGHSRHIVSE